MEWEEKLDKVHQLFSRVPLYNKVGLKGDILLSHLSVRNQDLTNIGFLQISKQFELDFRDRGRAELRIQRSVKNFQLTLEVC